ACSNFIAKNTVRNIKLNNEKEILEIKDKIDEKYKEYAIFTSIVIILSIFFLFIVEYNILR
uniref:hypothetical protein n=1 Tax=uncultured Desulfovibrio sp. TaxID=167968 RepID=UPI002670AA37